MRRDPVTTVHEAVRLWIGRANPTARLGLGLFGLAVSGGADSMTLADAAISEAGAENVVLIYIDHGLSPGSAAVGDQVTAWARGQGVAAIVRRVEVERRASIEAAARDARYAALEAIATETGIAWTLLGHTARDQAETVLMRIVRGTGPAGLAGIPMIRGRFVRPLLGLPREVIDAYVAARGLPTWDDPMNADRRIARVRFREQIMPLLRAENPALDEALCRLATHAREWMNAIDDQAEPVSKFPLDCATLVKLEEPAVRKRGYALALEEAGLGYDAVHLDAIDRMVARPSEGELSVDVPGGRVVRSYNELAVHRAIQPDALLPPEGHEIRMWRPGDRMKPARLKGRSRKLSDLFIDAKVPRELRRTARVLVRTNDQVIVWAEHLGIAFGMSPSLVPKPHGTGGSF